MQKTIILEDLFPNPINTAFMYDTPTIIQWYLDGYDSIKILPERKREFLYYAAANGLLNITSDGKAYVAGMEII